MQDIDNNPEPTDTNSLNIGFLEGRIEALIQANVEVTNIIAGKDTYGVKKIVEDVKNREYAYREKAFKLISLGLELDKLRGYLPELKPDRTEVLECKKRIAEILAPWPPKEKQNEQRHPSER